MLWAAPASAAPGSTPGPVPASVSVPWAAVGETLGKAGTGAWLLAGLPAERRDAMTALPVAMGTGIAINFKPTDGGKAAIAGDFVLVASEVNPVLRTLREHGIAVTALHNHMLNDQPRLFFMHFWANDDAGRLARGLKAALDQMNLKKG
ncbi:DUF1259 domain-containing protein [Nguyenibacter vanlangensis]